MSKKSFYKLSMWERILICIGAFSVVMAGVYNFVHWVNDITEKVCQTQALWVKTIVGAIFLILGLGITFLVLYANSVFPYIRQLLKKLPTDETRIVINKITEENTYIQCKDKLGEIVTYWGDRSNAEDRIKGLLKSTTSTKIFIAAIGFTTIKKFLSDSDIITHFATLINNNHSIEITIVFPQNIEQLKKARPEISQPRLSEKFNDGQTLLKNFRTNLRNATPNKNIDRYVKFKHYNNLIMPRHFILQDDKTVFFGSYLTSELGSDSYLIELCDTNNSNKQEKSGLYHLFLNEIRNIDQNSQQTNFNNI